MLLRERLACIEESPKFLLLNWETDLLPLLVLTRRGRSTGKNQYW